MRARDAEGLVDQRYRHRHLAVGLLAQDTTVLPGDPDRVPALFGDPRVVHHPRRHRSVTLELRQGVVRSHPQQRLGVPRRIGHEVVHRLVPGPHVGRIDLRRHRLDALALARQEKTRQVVPQRLPPVRMAQHRAQTLDIRFEPLSLGLVSVCHAKTVAQEEALAQAL